MDQYIKQADDMINNALEPFVKKPTLVRGIVHLLLILYATKMAPVLPKSVEVLFVNQYFQLLVFSLVLWTAQFSPSTSILIAIAFMVSVNYSTNRKQFWEFLENTESHDEPITTQPPVAPVKETALIVQTTAEPVVVAPAIVSTKEVEKAVVEPEVAVLEAPSSGEPASVEGIIKSEVPQESGCYPLRRYDMSAVSGFEDEHFSDFKQ